MHACPSTDPVVVAVKIATLQGAVAGVLQTALTVVILRSSITSAAAGVLGYGVL